MTVLFFHENDMYNQEKRARPIAAHALQGMRLHDYAIVLGEQAAEFDREIAITWSFASTSGTELYFEKAKHGAAKALGIQERERTDSSSVYSASPTVPQHRIDTHRKLERWPRAVGTYRSRPDQRAHASPLGVHRYASCPAPSPLPSKSSRHLQRFAALHATVMLGKQGTVPSKLHPLAYLRHRKNVFLKTCCEIFTLQL